MQPSGDLHLVISDIKKTSGVVKDQRHFRQIHCFALRTAAEDDIAHAASAAQRLHALLAEHPADRIIDVAFAASVRSDDAGDI